MKSFARRALGKTGLLVSPVGLGTVKFGRLGGLKYPAEQRLSELPSDERVIEVLRAAHESGVNVIDTAPAYGQSERRLGELMGRVARRDSWVVCTKVGEEFDEGSGKSTYDFSAKGLAESVIRSCMRLRTGWLDVVLLHFSSSVDDVEVLRRGEAMGTLFELKSAGVIRAVGASTASVEGGKLAAEICDVVMLTLSVGEKPDELVGDVEVLNACQRSGAGVLVKKVLGSGEQAVSAREVVGRVCKEKGVSSVIVGTSNPEHVREVAMGMCDGAMA